MSRLIPILMFPPNQPWNATGPCDAHSTIKAATSHGLLLTTCRFSKPKLNINVCFGGMFTIVVLLNKYMQFSHDYWSQESDPLKCSVMYGTQVVTTPGIRPLSGQSSQQTSCLHSRAQAQSWSILGPALMSPDLSKNNSQPDGGLIIVCILGLVW